MEVIRNNMQYNNFMKRRNLPKVKKEKTNILLKYSSLLLAVLGLFIPAFYLLGLRFYEGILSVYGIEHSSLLTLDTTDVYVYGYYIISHVLLDYLSSFPFIMLTAVLFILGLMFLLMIYRVFSSKQRFMKIVYLFKTNEIKDKVAERLFEFYKMTILLLPISAILGVLWITIPHMAYKKGQEIQVKNIRDYHVFGCEKTINDWSICTQVLDKNNTQVFEGLLIATKGDRVAFYQENGSKVFTLKSDQKLYRAKLLETNTTK